MTHKISNLGRSGITRFDFGKGPKWGLEAYAVMLENDFLK
jgi:hypothetical protein